MILMVLAITVISAFDLKCPEELERTIRAKFVCYNNTPVNSYSCLLDQDANVYTESCTDTADFVRPGQKYVRSGGRKNVDCSPLRYQPLKFWSHELSRCVYKKSKCDEWGQLLNGSSSSLTDNACRCDYTAGFDFVTAPRNKCGCIPTEEDCMCYLVSCPKEMQLDQDYNCSSRENMTSTFRCPPINKTAAETKAPSPMEGKEKQPTIRIAGTCLIVLAVILSTIFAVIVLKRNHRSNTTTEGQNKSQKDKISPEKAVDKLRIIIEILEKLLGHREFDTDFQEELSEACPNYMTVLQTYKRDLLENDCGILIAGETSAGKTTLINQLVGKHVFYTSNLAATGTVCRIRNSNSLSVKTHQKDQLLTKKAANLDELKSIIRQYTSIDKNPPEMIDVYLPVPILKGNVIIVDTPGIGENDNLDNILLDFLPHAVSFIFIVNASNAGGIHKDRLLRILKTVLEKRNEMPCFEPEEVIFLTNQWDNIKNKKDDGDEEDPHTKTINQIKSKLEAGWPSFCTDRLFKISLEQVRKRQKTPFTTEFKNFQLKLDETIEKNKNKRVEYYFRFVKRFAANAEMGIVSRINLLKQSDDDRRKLVEKNEETVIQLFRVTDKNKKAAEKYKNEVITKLAKLLLNYLMSETGRRELLSPPGRKDINSVPLTSFTEDIFTRINIGINRWCAGEDVQKVIREIESKMKDLLSDVQTMIHNIEEDITGFTRSINDVSFCVFTRSALRVTLMSNGITFLEFVRSLVKEATVRDLSMHLVKEKRAIAIYEKWRSTFTYDHIQDSFEENFGAEYDKVINQIFGVEIPQKITGFRFTINKLLAELNDNEKKNRSFTELQRLVQDLHTRIEEFEDEVLI